LQVAAQGRDFDRAGRPASGSHGRCEPVRTVTPGRRLDQKERRPRERRGSREDGERFGCLAGGAAPARPPAEPGPRITDSLAARGLLRSGATAFL